MNAQVIVVGAGVSGLATAHHLTNRGYKVLVVEASDRIGGRIRCELEPGGAAIEVGAEIVHEISCFNQFFQNQNWEIQELISWAQGDGPAEYIPNQLTGYWFNNERRLINSVSFDDILLDEHGEVAKQIPIKDELAQETKRSSAILRQLGENGIDQVPSMTLNEYLRHHQKLTHPSVLQLIEAGYSNTYCSSSDLLNAKYIAYTEGDYIEERNAEFRLRDGYSHTIIPFLQEGLDIRTNWQLIRVDHSDPFSVCLTNQIGETLRCNRVVITVQCSLLFDIQFIPQLPASFRKTIESIVVQPAIKLILLFSKRFWPKELHGMICSGCVFPEIWFIERNDSSFAAVGFATSSFAKSIQALGLDAAIEAFKNQLNTIFGGKNKPAHNYFYKHFYFDWSKHPFTKGGYVCILSPETKESLLGFRDPKIFMAGEIYAKDYTSVTGALESSTRAADLVSASLPLARL